MSYVRHKDRAFRDAGDIPELVRRRSEGRLKNYPSTEDARAWCDITDDRRQQILDYVLSDVEKCSVGKYVPIDVLINTLLANKNSDCGKLREQVEQLQKLLDVYSKLELTEDQKKQLGEMKQRIEAAGSNLGAIAGTKLDSGRCAAIKREQEGVPCTALDKYDDGDLKSLLIKKDAEINTLKNKLAAMQSDLDQLRGGKSIPGGSTLGSRDEPCVQEIEGLEREIQRLKSKGLLNAEEETEIIRKEIEVLKKYCAKLAAIQDENQALKRQLETGSMPSIPPDLDLNGLKQELNDKIAKLNEVMNERDRLKNKTQVLEQELIKYQDLPEDIETIKRKSQMLDSVSEECKKLRTSLEGMKTVEDEMGALKDKADKANDLQTQLESANKELVNIRNQSAVEIETLKSKNNEILKERENYKKVAMDARNMGEELKCLANCAKEAETLKRERDNLRAKLQKLCCIEMQYKQLQEKVKYLENVKSEREMYKMKYEEMLGLECDCEMLKAQVEKFKGMDKDRQILVNQVRDCECCIEEQEEEIKKLIAYIDNVSKGNNEQQVRMQKELNNIKNELNQKKNLIAASDRQLSCVQEQLRKTIKSVSCETSCLRIRISDLEERLTKKTKIGTVCKPKDGNTATREDEHYTEMLVQSKYAVKRISEELEKHFKQCESVNAEDLERLHAETSTLKLISMEAQKSVNTTENISKANDDIMIKYEQAEKKIAYLEKQLAECNASDSNKKQEEVERLNAENVTLKRISIEAQNNFTATDNSTSNADYDLQEQYTQATLKIANLEKQLAECKLDIERLTAESNTLKELTANNDAMNAYQDEKRKNDELQEQLKQCQATVAELRESAQTELERLNAENVNLKKVSCDLQSDINENNDNITKRLETAQKRISALESELQGVKEERDQLNEIVRQYKESEIRTLSNIGATEFNATSDVNEIIQPRIIAKSGDPQGDIEELKLELAKCKEKLQQEIKWRQERECAYKRSKTSQFGPTLTSVGSQIIDDELQKCKEEKKKLMAQLESQKREMIEKGVFVGVDTDFTEKAEMQQLIKELEDQTEAMERGPVVDNSELKKLEAQLQREQSTADAAEVQLQKVYEEQGADIPLPTEMEASDIKRLSQAYEERLSQSNMELELANSIKKQQDQEIKSLQSKYSDGIVKLQASHEEILKEVDKEHQKEVENLRSELRRSQETIDSFKRQLGSISSSAKGLSEISLREKLSSIKKVASIAETSEKLTNIVETESEKSTPISKVESDKLVPVQKMASKELTPAVKKESEMLTPISKGVSKKSITVEKASSKELASVGKVGSEKSTPTTLATIKAESSEKLTTVARKASERLTPISKVESKKSIPTEKVSTKELSPAGKGDNDTVEKVSSKEPASVGKVGSEKSTPTTLATIEAESAEKLTTVAKTASERLTPISKVESKKSIPTEKVPSKEQASAVKGETEELLPISEIKTKKMAPVEKVARSGKGVTEQLPLTKKETSEKPIASGDRVVTKERAVIDKKLGDRRPTKEEEVSEEAPSTTMATSPTRDNVPSEKLPTSDKIQQQILAEPATELQGTTPSVKRPSLSKETQVDINIPPVDKVNAEAAPSRRVCRCGQELYTLLQKVVRYGLESLNFEELKLLHNKTCEATAALLRKYPNANNNVQFSHGSTPNDENKKKLCKRITTLENDLLKKQKQTQEKVGSLQIALKMERQRLQDFKTLLETEKDRNNELMCKIGAQSRTVANMEVEREVILKKSSFNEEKLQSLIKHCKHEKMRIQRLEDELAKEKSLHKEEIKAFERQVRASKVQPNSKSARSSSPCRCKRNDHGAAELEVMSCTLETKDIKRTCKHQACIKEHRHHNKSSKQHIASELEEVD